MLSNAVLLELLRETVVYAVKCYTPRVITWRRLCMLSNAVPLDLLLGDN